MRNLTLKNLKELANGKPVLCTNVEEDKEFANGQYTDRVIGSKYDCVLKGCGYEKITIKTAEREPAITMEMIEMNDGEIEVVADDFSCKVYVDRKTCSLKFSITASTVRPAQPNNEPNVLLFGN